MCASVMMFKRWDEVEKLRRALREMIVVVLEKKVVRRLTDFCG